MRSTSEKEAKLAAWAGFVLPELGALTDGLSARPLVPALLDAVYWDTRDLRLARWGVTVRFRTRDGSAEGHDTGWTLKLPGPKDGSTLVRRELLFDGPPGSAPEPLLELVKGMTRSTPLVAVARLRTRRTGIELVDGNDDRVAEVVDDEVSVYEGRKLASRFREIEVEVLPAAGEGLLDDVVAELCRAGAAPTDPVAKVVRALGARAQEPPELVAGELPEHATLADVVRRAIVSATAAVVRNHAGVRLGDEPEAVHQARVGTRRLRSDLSTFGSLLDPDWTVRTREELRWLGSALGGVRDADVLLERLQRQAGALPAADAAGAGALMGRLEDQRRENRERLLAAMSSARYAALLDTLVAASNHPPLLPGADEPAAGAVARLVEGPWSKLARSAARMPDDAPDQELHDLRIRAKRCRYAAEAVSPVAGKPAARLAKAVAGLQTVLGDHQDAVVAEAWIREEVAGGQPLTIAAGELVLLQRLEAETARREWPEAWKRARRKSLRSWMTEGR